MTGKPKTLGSQIRAKRRLADLRTQQALADAIGVSVRAVRNWETDTNRPDPGTLALLERVLGPLLEGDPVEAALRESELHEWRQDAVLSEYKKHLHEQRAERAG